MKKIFKLTVCTGLIAPCIACAQLLNLNGPSLNLGFNTLISAMAADGAALYTGPGEANAAPFSQVSWDSSGSKWVIGSLLSGNGDLAFELQAANQQYFYMTGNEINIGFVANENWNLNELIVNASKTGYPSQRLSLFDYSDHVPANHLAGNTVQLVNPVDIPIRLQFELINKTISPLVSIYQTDATHFRIFRQVTFNSQGAVAGFGSDWLLGIDDGNSFDQDGDDGYFYIPGDISPVPEPSQMTLVSLLVVGTVLIVHRGLRRRSA